MAVNESYKLGLEGEEYAIKYLSEKGYDILEKRWRFKNLEIDIIAKKDNILIITEVKTRSSSYFGEPYTFVNKKKQKFIIEATNYYIENKNIDLEIRFDIISLLKKENKFKLEHIKQAFIPL